MDEDGALDIIAVNPTGCRVYNADGTLQWGYYSTPWHISKASPAIGDVDGDGLPEIVLGRVDDDSGSPAATLFCLENDGTLKWSKLYTGEGGREMPFFATAAIGDISSSHSGNEIAIATAQTFQETYPNGEVDPGSINWVRLLDGSGNTLWTSSDYLCQFWASPVVGDIDGDQVNELVIGSCQNWDDGKKVFVLNGNTGSQEHVWSVGGWVQHPAALADLDDDGYLDVIVACNDHKVYAWSGDTYQSLPGFPVDMGGTLPAGCPAVADIDGDFDLEVVVGCGSGDLWAFNPDGSVCTGFPVDAGSSLRGGPAIGDIDGDGRLEIFVADETSATAYCYDMGSSSFPCEMPWRQFQHDSWHSGYFEADNTIPEPPTDLAADVSYTMFGYTADLSWDLSVNDIYSPDPEDPCDVVSYQIYRAFPPDGFNILSRTHAGDGTYTDQCNSPLGPIVRYVVTASDGTNESEYSNEVRFRTTPGTNLAMGCRVSEELETVRPADISHDAVIGSIESTPIREALSSSRSALLTDGRLGETYQPSAGVSALEIDLGRECRVSNVDIAGCETPSGSTGLDHTRCSVQVSSDGETWSNFCSADEVALSPAEGRYIRLSPAPVASEIFVWGVASETEADVATIDIRRNSGCWSLSIPVMDDCSTGIEGTLIIYDISGRVVRSFNVESGEEVVWDGLTSSGTAVSPGCYFVRFDTGDEAVTSRLLVTGE
jgi:hypothetical protein